ncbi:MAG: ABC transporter permease [Candidatus Hydrogenedentales bacterium]|jgi:ribose/xylose/arabinose/galactoside ABC-type transport system permease subunit
MKRFLSKNLLVLIMGAVCLFLAWRSQNFLTEGNLLNLIRRTSAVAVTAVGETLVIITGGIDLSVGSVAALAGVVSTRVLRDSEFPVLVGILVGIGTGLLCGGINGALVTRGKIPPFIVTLGMMLAARGAAHVLAGGSRISGMSSGFRLLGGSEVPWIPFVVTLVIVAIFAVVLYHTRFGRQVYAAGGNLVSARLSGVPVDWVRFSVYALCGMLAGFAGIMISSRTGVGDPTMAEGMELDSIAACVVGGASLMGGEGGAFGALFGALIIGTLVQLCQLNGMSDEWQRIVVGTLIVVLVFFDNMRKRRSGRLSDL